MYTFNFSFSSLRQRVMIDVNHLSAKQIEFFNRLVQDHHFDFACQDWIGDAEEKGHRPVSFVYYSKSGWLNVVRVGVAGNVIKRVQVGPSGATETK